MSKNDVKIRNFKVKGQYRDVRGLVNFSRDVRAVKEQDAIEKVYLSLGSNQGIKRNRIEILETIEVEVEQIKDNLNKEIATNPSLSLRK